MGNEAEEEVSTSGEVAFITILYYVRRARWASATFIVEALVGPARLMVLALASPLAVYV